MVPVALFDRVPEELGHEELLPLRQAVALEVPETESVPEGVAQPEGVSVPETLVVTLRVKLLLPVAQRVGDDDAVREELPETDTVAQPEGLKDTLAVTEGLGDAEAHVVAEKVGDTVAHALPLFVTVALGLAVGQTEDEGERVYDPEEVEEAHSVPLTDAHTVAVTDALRVADTLPEVVAVVLTDTETEGLAVPLNVALTVGDRERDGEGEPLRVRVTLAVKEGDTVPVAQLLGLRVPEGVDVTVTVVRPTVVLGVPERLAVTEGDLEADGEPELQPLGDGVVHTVLDCDTVALRDREGEGVEEGQRVAETVPLGQRETLEEALRQVVADTLRLPVMEGDREDEGEPELLLLAEAVTHTLPELVTVGLRDREDEGVEEGQRVAVTELLGQREALKDTVAQLDAELLKVPVAQGVALPDSEALGEPLTVVHSLIVLLALAVRQVVPLADNEGVPLPHPLMVFVCEAL